MEQFENKRRENFLKIKVNDFDNFQVNNTQCKHINSRQIIWLMHRKKKKKYPNTLQKKKDCNTFKWKRMIVIPCLFCIISGIWIWWHGLPLDYPHLGLVYRYILYYGTNLKLSLMIYPDLVVLRIWIKVLNLLWYDKSSKLMMHLILHRHKITVKFPLKLVYYDDDISPVIHWVVLIRLARDICSYVPTTSSS